MNYSLTTAPSEAIRLPTSGVVEDKFIEEHWIDQNGIALMVNPFNGSLIRAK